MKNLFLLLVVLISLQFQSKADTIDYYHVYFNASVIRKYNEYNKNKPETVITLKKDSLQSGDVIQIRYWNDTGTSNSGTIKVFDEYYQLLDEVTFENNYYTIPVALLLEQPKRRFRVSYKYKDTFSNATFESTLLYIQIE